jgi:hypothetical protein
MNGRMFAAAAVGIAAGLAALIWWDVHVRAAHDELRWRHKTQAPG